MSVSSVSCPDCGWQFDVECSCGYVPAGSSAQAAILRGQLAAAMQKVWAERDALAARVRGLEDGIRESIAIYRGDGSLYDHAGNAVFIVRLKRALLAGDGRDRGGP